LKLEPTRRQLAALLAATAAAMIVADTIAANTIALATTPEAAGAHDFAFENINGTGELRLADFAGRPVLVVNTASRCGYTYQYDALQALYDRYRARGLVVLGVPSDDFNQELASEAEVKDFCAVNFAIDFPMTAITHVTGGAAHPFYAWAAAQAGAPRWNFHKYLLAPDGRLVAAFSTKTEPDAPEVTEAIEALLREAANGQPAAQPSGS
jgi:glutathione peroxidase